jgi:uncharacterized protein DUF4154
VAILTQSVLIIGLLFAPPALVASGPENRLEYQVKAAFLYNFLKFVDWPEAAGDTPLVICVLGRDPFGGLLEDAVRGKKVNGHDVLVRHAARASDAQSCQILFVPNGEFRRSGVHTQQGVLMVGESAGFLDAGGVIDFYIDNDRVRFEIRPESARTAGLHISAQLLKLGSSR